MTKFSIVVACCAMIVVGVIFFIVGHRKRNSLDTPLLSNHAKIFIGGSLIVFGIGFLTFMAVK
jgi:hypothetical protein